MGASKLLAAWAILLSGCLVVDPGALRFRCEEKTGNCEETPVLPSGLGQKLAASPSPPDVMLVVDKSGSMRLPIDAAEAACSSGCGVSIPCPVGCPIRWDIVRDGVGEFLAPGSTPPARLGLLTFPVDAQCGAPGQTRVELPGTVSGPAEWASSAGQVRSAVVAISSSGESGTLDTLGGGTPAGETLRWLEGYAPLREAARPRTLVLITDGLPNCNAANPNACTQPSACRCTLANGECGGALSERYCRAGCLDESSTVERLNSLRTAGVKTALVGVGPETASAKDVLNAMATAGGLPLRCSAEAPACGAGDVCDTATGLCGVRFHQVHAANGLFAALKKVMAEALAEARCHLVLEGPVEVPERLRVMVGDVALERRDWVLLGRTVVLQGQACAGQRSGSAPAAELWSLE